jgi:type II secretory pathway pseudopilin PulG
MKKRMIIIGIVIVGIVSTMTLGNALRSKETRMGKVAKEASQESDNKGKGIAIKGKDFAVTKESLETKVKYFKANGTENPEQEAKNSIIERESLYALAVSKGYSASEEEVNQVVQEIKEGVETVDDKSVNDYINGFGSEEEFWEFEKELESKNLVIKKYLTDEKTSYLGKENNFTQIEENKWQKKYDAIIEKAIKRQNIKEMQ